ncbi:Peptide ABC transporter permease [Glutamicibacter creatinolyticus]|uniref:Peptide ABC transporter permease n=3 Tax=Micrococcaceae TaxID=1268 RepID=A0A5B7WRS6_9MICC|nr:ABC transporter permease [Glutamicibacter creatinolyticus]QCY46015.1 Peptide ABC transporter permease [Glutamicibacter creatinolyticus]
MGGYIAKRVGQALLVIWLAYTAVFLAVQALPNDPVTIFLSTDAAADPATIAQLKAHYGYDQPLITQYLGQLCALLRGDLGYSLSSGAPVAARIGEVIGSTLVLAGSAFVLAVLLAVALVAAATLARGERLRRALLNLPPLFISIPVFWLGLVLLQLLAVQLGVMSLFPDGSALSLLVPILVLALHLSAPIAQVLLKSVQQVSAQPFVDVLRAKGAGESWIFYRHTLKNAAPAALSIAGITIGTLLAGSVITETVFARAGLGQLVLQAVTVQDIPLVQGLVLLTAATFTVVNLLVDLIHPQLDPRIITAHAGSARALAA